MRLLIVCLFALELDSSPFTSSSLSMQDERKQSKICRRFLKFSVIHLSAEYLLRAVLGGKNAILCHLGEILMVSSTALLWEMLELRLTQRVLFLLPCEPNNIGRKIFPKWFILKTLSPTRDSCGTGHWGSGFMKKLSKFLLFLPSAVTSCKLDSDKVTSLRKKLLQKERIE